MLQDLSQAERQDTNKVLCCMQACRLLAQDTVTHACQSASANLESTGSPGAPKLGSSLQKGAQARAQPWAMLLLLLHSQLSLHAC